MNASLLQLIEGGLWLAALALGGTLLLDVGTSAVGEDSFASGIGRGPDATTTAAWSRTGLTGLSSTLSAEAPRGWHALRHRLEACGQDPSTVLEVAVESGTGRWPWSVEVRRSTEGAEACIATVLSTAPLHPDLPTPRQSLRVRMRLQELSVVDAVAPKPFESECTAIHELPGFPGIPARATSPVAPDAAAPLVCPHPSPLVRATLTYDDGRLVDIATEPSAPCVEAAALEHVAHIPDAWQVHDTLAAEQRVCTFDLPMVAP